MKSELVGVLDVDIELEEDFREHLVCSFDLDGGHYWYQSMRKFLYSDLGNPVARRFRIKELQM